jgi:hypothetical protein
LRGVRVMQRNRLTDGTRPARRARLTSLKDADPNSFYVDENTKEMVLVQAEKEERRRLARAGKLGQKKQDSTKGKEAAAEAPKEAAPKAGAPAAGGGGGKTAAKAAAPPPKK